jgi:hypothetical protein
MFATDFHMRQAFILLIISFSVLYFQAVTSGCANIIPPQGGPRDSLGPRLVEASPPNGTVNFKGDRITLTFDEYVDLQNVSSNLLFTPTMEPGTYKATVKLRTITIDLPDTLEKNTTYVFNFGNAIKDFNEGNVAKGFTYTFSTGPRIDSLEFRGKVVMAENGRIDSNLIVILHRDLSDSAVVKARAPYVTTLNSQGEFLFKNLPPGTFNVYALGDAGLSRRYLSKSQVFAFSDSAIVVSDSTAPVTLYAYSERPPQSLAAVTPSVGRPGNTADRRLRFNLNLVGNQLDLLKDLQITFDQKLKYLDSTKVRLTTDTTFTPSAFSISLDSTKKIATVRSKWIPGMRYQLIVDKDFAEDTLGRKLFKTDTLNFQVKKTSEYGSMVVKLKNAASYTNPVLQLLQNGNVVYSGSLRNGSVTEEIFLPGDYDVRILEDLNNNGKWDPGQFFNKRQQPEIARPIERKLTIRPAFRNEVELSL